MVSFSTIHLKKEFLGSKRKKSLKPLIYSILLPPATRHDCNVALFCKTSSHHHTLLRTTELEGFSEADKQHLLLKANFVLTNSHYLANNKKKKILGIKLIVTDYILIPLFNISSYLKAKEFFVFSETISGQSHSRK